MTTITYTITLTNSDGTKAEASSGSLNYFDIATRDLHTLAKYQVEKLERGTLALMEMANREMSKKIPQPARPIARKTNGAAVGK